ncbi:cysteine protease StiP family protein [Neobacillus muris]|uniref:cysteine protease StiP family protein n=1 Tax=Neobacillus muris TaxID=2941334 RepID=UPI00203F1F68|nr:cysteine protease StiP family protein [Neobacillus muris]
MQELMNKPAKIGSYSDDDVLFLLKDLSEVQLEDTTDNREWKMQSGGHYSESLPIEYQPPQPYVDLFWKALHEYKEKVALCIGIVAEQIYQLKGKQAVLVSLARAGTPAGILIKRYIKYRFNLSLPHYSVSIIRDKGIDENAIHYIRKAYPNGKIQFIDGWTGKGAISIELSKACQEYEQKYDVHLDDTLAVIADPGFCTTMYGTREDFLIPSACLNSTVSGLVSRTVLNNQYIGKDDFHGAKFYKELADEDVSNQFIDIIEGEFPKIADQAHKSAAQKKEDEPGAIFLGMQDVKKIQEEFSVENTHLIKPGVGETTRVLLRRVPWKILMRDKTSPYVQHILLLAAERNVEVEEYSGLNYLCCGIIKTIKGPKK